MAQGTVSKLFRYPVKSMGGEQVRSSNLDWRGMGGDRTHAVFWEHQGEMRRTTAEGAPRLMAWSASYPAAPDAGLNPADPPPAQVVSPDGERFDFPDSRLRERLAQDLRRRVELRRSLDGMQDVGGTLLITIEASVAALGAELGREVDVRRFRTNVHLDLDAEPFAEAAWTGALLRLDSGVRLRVVEPCDRCAAITRDPETLEKWGDLLRHVNDAHETFFGIRCRVEAGGRIEVGQSLQVEPPL